MQKLVSWEVSFAASNKISLLKSSSSSPPGSLFLPRSPSKNQKTYTRKELKMRTSPPRPPLPPEESETQKTIQTNITDSDNSSACSSPRLSFSDDLHQAPQEVGAANMPLSLSDPNSDFNFCQLEHQSELSPADELFSGGVILPMHNTKRQINTNPIICSDQQSAELTVPDNINNVSEFDDQEITTTKASLIREERSESKSFWRFRRSSSFNCHGHDNKKCSASSSSSSIWSLPFLLRRSNSTGSASVTVSAAGENTKNGSCHNKKQSPKSNSAIKLSSSWSSTTPSSGLQKPPLNLKKKKSHGIGSSGSNGGSVLNVPPPYIIKGTSDLLGIASFFRNGKHRNSSSTRKP
ncbi:hypothetical protein Ancab_029065 [Ancistrocladus abbreviatus]